MLIKILIVSLVIVQTPYCNPGYKAYCNPCYINIARIPELVLSPQQILIINTS